MRRQFSPEIRDSSSNMDSTNLDWDGTAGSMGIVHSLDPQDCLGAVARDDSAAKGAAELAVFAWVLGLPAGRDPAEAAERLTATWPISTFAGSGGERERLLTLLQEIACFPADRLARFHRGAAGLSGRRRGEPRRRRREMHPA